MAKARDKRVVLNKLDREKGKDKLGEQNWTLVIKKIVIPTLTNISVASIRM